VAERDGIAKHDDAKRIRRLVERIVFAIAKAKGVDPHGHAGEPAVIAGRQSLAAMRIGEEEAGPSLPVIPSHPHPQLDQAHADRGTREQRAGGEQQLAASAQAHPRNQ